MTTVPSWCVERRTLLTDTEQIVYFCLSWAVLLAGKSSSRTPPSNMMSPSRKLSLPGKWELLGLRVAGSAASRRLRMTRYQLAKIVDWAGTLDTRKRMQKVVYLLQVVGLPARSGLYAASLWPLFARRGPC